MVGSPFDIHFPTLMPTQQSLWSDKKSAILQKLSKVEIQALMLHNKRIELKQGQTWYIQEEGDSRIYIVDRGYARQCRLLPAADRRIILSFLRPADVFGDFPGSTAPVNYSDYIEAAQDVRPIAIESIVFWDVLKNHPNFMMRLIEILSQQQERLQKRVLSISIKDVYARVSETLLDVSEKLGENCTHGDCQRYVALTHQEISDLSGIARPTVSKVISELLQAGILKKHERHVGLIDLGIFLKMTEEGASALNKESDKHS